MENIKLEKIINYLSSGWEYHIISVAIFITFCIIDYVLNKENSVFTRIREKEKSVQFDLKILFLDVIKVFPILSIILSLGLAVHIRKVLEPYELTNYISEMGSPALQVIAYLIIVDFLSYWFHRASHTVPSLWELHKVHHSAESMNFITSNRRHPLEQALKKAFIYIPLFVIGAPVETYILVTLFLISTGYIHHFNSEWKFGIIGKYLLVSPKYHLIHHSINPQHYNKNFAVRLVWWDKIFGSYHSELDNVESIGIDNNNHNNDGLFKTIVISQINFIKKLFSYR